MSTTDSTPSDAENPREHPSGKPPEARTRAENRFWNKVNYINNEDGSLNKDVCWVWDASTGEDGYGTFWYENKVRRANRVTIAITTDIDYDDIDNALHKCGNRSCCNPAHIYDGTRAENWDDAVEHGTVRGFTHEEVREMREMRDRGLSYNEIADELDEHKQTVYRIITRQHYARVE